MAEQAELAFVKSFANAISSQPVVYGNDYQTAPENELKKVPVLPVSRICGVEFHERLSGISSEGYASHVLRSTLRLHLSDTARSLHQQVRAN